MGWVKICLAENKSRIYPNMCAKFGCGSTVQTDRQRETVALYSRLAGYPASLWRKGGGGGRKGRDGGSGRTSSGSF